VVAGRPGQEARYGREAALRLLAAVLPRLNWRGADAAELGRATRIVDDAEAFAADAERRGGKPEPPWQRIVMTHWPPDDLLVSMDPVARLAFEMAVTEEVERRALAGEAAAFEGRWRDAEEVAGIADALLVPAFVTDWLARRGKGRRRGGDASRGSRT
jgi:anthranilate phosphoribosyltransferase